VKTLYDYGVKRVIKVKLVTGEERTFELGRELEYSVERSYLQIWTKVKVGSKYRTIIIPLHNILEMTVEVEEEER
jgi:hypothetical protein